MTISDDENEADQIETPMFPRNQFPPLGARDVMTHTAAPSVDAPIVEQVANDESSTAGGDLDQVLNRLNLEHV